MHRMVSLLFLLLWLTTLSVGQECLPDQVTCSFSLNIEPRLTMMYNKTRVRPCNGQLCYYNDNVPLPENIQRSIITADGVYSRLVISVNDDIPGPAIIVYEGQNVEVSVTNNLHTDSVTVHFHGAHQRGTPFMDGVAFVTQCPILPEQTFVYRFKAEPHGTHWYHAHIGDQRSMGLYGPYIVKRRNEPTDYVDEHIITLQDWNHDMDPETAYLKMVNGIYNCNLEGTNCDKYNTTQSVDGGKFSVFQFHSGLINGKGRFYLGPNSHNNAPLTSFTVEKDKQYRFRVISAATLYPFRLYVAGHKLTVVASDGRELQPIEVESFVIHTGERMDFILNTSRSEGDYMIIAETLEVLGTNSAPHRAEAILRYNSSSARSTPNSNPVPCQDFPDGLCPVFNCPFRYFPKYQNRECLTFNDASSTSEELPDDYENVLSSPADKSFFLNFAFPGESGNMPGSVNAHMYESPSVSAYSQPQELGSVSCDKCEKKPCECMYSISIKNNDIVELVFLNMGVGKGWSHPIHLHGHSFYVLAMGYPTYDNNTGMLTAPNPDVACTDSDMYCDNAIWQGSRPKRQTDGLTTFAPLKDTIVVPTDGYVWVRFKADNPGVWFLHCHIDLHNTNGMAMVVNESFRDHRITGMPRCRNYLSDDQYNRMYNNKQSTNSERGTVIGLGVSMVGAVVFAVVLGIVLK